MKPEHVNAQQAYKLLKAAPDMVVLDLRTADEYEMFYITDAVNLDCGCAFFERRIKRLDRDLPYLIHCHSGSRSIKALAHFKKHNFTNITHMDGGLRAWMHEGLPLVST